MEDLVLSGYKTYEVQKGRQGICVQIGLHQTAEYLYLVRPDWRDLIGQQDLLKQIPDSLADKFESWRYYGVDSDVASIVKMLEKYGNVPYSSWIQAAVGLPNDQFLKVRSYFSGGSFLGFGCSLQRLFRLLDLSQVDVFIIDIEGGELRLFENYDWHIKPAYISVEVHGDHSNTSHTDRVLLEKNITFLHGFLTSKGYRLLKKEYTNLNTTGYCTCELQYLL